MSGFKGLVRGLKNVVIQYEPIEVKVREATSSDNWGTKTTLMSEIARATNDHQQYNKLFAMVWKRLNSTSSVLHVLKSMILVEYLLRNGSDRFIRDVKDRIDTINEKKRFQVKGSNQEDVERARQVRRKAAGLIALVSDEKRLHRERLVADRIKNVKNSAVSSANYSAPSPIKGVIHPREAKKQREASSSDDSDSSDDDVTPNGGKPGHNAAFADDPFAVKPKKKAVDPFDTSFSSDPFASNSTDPFGPSVNRRKSVDPFAAAAAPAAPAPAQTDPFANSADPFGSAPKTARQTAPTSDPFAAQAPSVDPFASAAGNSDPFGSAPARAQAPAQTQPALADIFGGSGGPSATQKQPTLDFLSGGGPEESKGTFDGFTVSPAPQPKKKNTLSVSGMVNLDNIMQQNVTTEPKKISLNQLADVGVDIFGGASQPTTTPSRRPLMKNTSSSDVFFDKKSSVLSGMFGGTNQFPQPQFYQQPQTQPAYNPFAAQQNNMMYPGARMPMGVSPNMYGQPAMNQMQQPMQQRAPAQYPFPNVAPNVTSNPFQNQQKVPQTKPTEGDAFNGLTW